MAQFENYVNDHLRYFKDQVKKIMILILMLVMVIMNRFTMVMIFVNNMLQDHIMFTMGDDFQYQNAVMNYKNMDKVFFLNTEKNNVLVLVLVLDSLLNKSPKGLS